MDKPKIAHISSTYLRASETFAYAYTQNLKKYEPIVLCEATENLNRFPGPKVYQIRELSLLDRAINRLGRELFTRPLVTEKEYSQIINREKPAILHAHFATQGVYTIPLKNKHQLPLVTSVYGFDFSYKRITQVLTDSFGGEGYWQKAYQKLFQEGDLFLTYYEKGKRTLVSMGCPAEKITVFPNGINLEKFQFKPSGWGREIQILMVNRLTEKKGVAYAVRALALLVAKYPKVTLKILGDGELEKDIKALVRELHLEEKVIMPGFVGEEEVLAEYAKSHLFLAPGFTAVDGDDNGGGNVTVLEAMATGVVVIGTQESSEQFVEDGVNGLICRQKDPEDLAVKITSILDNPAQVAGMVEKSRKMVEEKYDAHKQARKLEEYYDSLLER